MPKILVIEDDVAYRAMLTEALHEAGYAVLAAENGDEGIKLCRQHHCPLVVTDIFMPEKEGLETIRELKQDFPTLKIIAISGGGRKGILGFLDFAHRLGADMTLSKPFSPPQMLSMVKELMTD